MFYIKVLQVNLSKVNTANNNSNLLLSKTLAHFVQCILNNNANVNVFCNNTETSAVIFEWP